MGRLLFWLLAAILLGAGTHLATVLFSPAVSMASVMSRFHAAAPLNRMTVLGPEILGTVLREPNPDIVYAVCPYDLQAGDLLIDASIPEFYWALSIYSNRGDNVYTLNDQQAGVSRLRFRLQLEKPAFDLQEVITGDEDAEEAAEVQIQTKDDTVLVKTPTADGLVMLRAFLPDQAYRARVTEQLAASSCATAGPPAP
jgi:uncharacterized membrane protein